VDRSGVCPGRWGDLDAPGDLGVVALRFAGRASDIVLTFYKMGAVPATRERANVLSAILACSRTGKKAEAVRKTTRALSHLDAT
jgi:hypothetical protein